MRLFACTVMMLLALQIVSAQNEASPNHYVTGGFLSFLTQHNTYPLSALSINSGIGGLYSNRTDETRNTTFAVQPYFGREINAHLIIGLQVEYRIGQFTAEDQLLLGQTIPYDFERKSHQIGIGIFSRHIFTPEKRFNLFLQPSVEYQILNEKERRDEELVQEEKANYIEIGIGGGVLYNVSDRIRAIIRTGGIQYVNGKWRIVDTNTENNFSSFGTNFSLSSIQIGFEVRI